MMKRIITCMALATVMMSCTKDPVPPGNGPGEDLGKGLFSFFMKAPLPPEQTRNTNDGLLGERLIEDVWLLLYDYSDESIGDLKYAWNLNAGFGAYDSTFSGDDIVDGSATSAGFQMKAKEVDKQPYMLLVIANPGYYKREGALTGFTNGTYGANGEWSDLTEDDPDNLNASDPWYTHAGLMTVNGLPGVDELKILTHLSPALICTCGAGDGGGWDPNPPSHTRYCPKYYWRGSGHPLGGDSPETLPYIFMSNANGLIPVTVDDIYESEEEAENNPVPVYIDRAVAKVQVTSDYGTDTFLPANVSRTGGTPKWYVNRINKKTYMYRQFAPVFDLLAPYYQGAKETAGNTYDREILYAVDPNYEAGSQKASHFGPNIGVLSAVASSYSYATENTMAFDAQPLSVSEKSATTVVLQVQLYYDDLIGSMASNYFSYKQKKENGDHEFHFFTLDQAKRWMEYPGEIPSAFGSEFQQYILGDRVASFFVKGTGSLLPHSNDSYWDDAYHVLPCKNGSPIYYHRSGINEYEIPIKHFNGTGAGYGIDRSYGYLGVVRNNYYKVHVRSVSGPGVPEPDNSTYISADVTINPWYIRDQDEDL